MKGTAEHMLSVEKEWLMSQIGRCFFQPWFVLTDVFLQGLIADCDDDVMDEVTPKFFFGPSNSP